MQGPYTTKQLPNKDFQHEYFVYWDPMPALSVPLNSLSSVYINSNIYDTIYIMMIIVRLSTSIANWKTHHDEKGQLYLTIDL